MRARVIKIGNSQGLRVPKPILEQTGIMDDVEIEVEKIESLFDLLRTQGQDGIRLLKRWAKRVMINPLLMKRISQIHGMKKNGNGSETL